MLPFGDLFHQPGRGVETPSEGTMRGRRVCSGPVSVLLVGLESPDAARCAFVDRTTRATIGVWPGGCVCHATRALGSR